MLPGVALAAGTIDTQVVAVVNDVFRNDVTDTTTFFEDYDSDSRDSAGEIDACASETGCSFFAGMGVITMAYASASTVYATNRASVSTHSVGRGSGSYASAMSFWMDEWTFSSVSTSGVVVLRFHLDGAWNDAGADYQFGVFDPTLPFSLPSDETPPFDGYGHPIEMASVASAEFSSGSLTGFASDYSGFQTHVASGTAEDGSVDWNFELRFHPVDGVTYTLASVLALTSSSSIPEDSSDTYSAGSADFDSTAALTQIILPSGVSFTSAAGASYNVTAVPEPETWATLIAGLGLVGWAVKRRMSLNWFS
ncbi:MAG: PEP-CTERM sorting domain-containing protein [Hydrogenophilaceae bacterium]|nr:PEP-CTERM sorting domain-containing protein [Hydrogenophilaceae bacterium]